jgi:endonuclease YncB( thermonuclease family)
MTETPIEPPSPARRIILMAAGLGLLAASFAFAVPRRAEIASAMAPPMTLEVPTEMPDMEPADEQTGTTQEDVVPGAPPPARPDAASNQAPAGAAQEASLAPSPARQDGKAGTQEVMQVLTRPVAVDTSTFLVGRARVKLSGVEAPMVGKRCDLTGGGTWPCGAKARTALRAWLRARSIRCEVPADFAESTSRTESSCTLDNKDIGAWLVENGWAEAAPGSRYEEAEAKARAARLGLWGDSG